MTGFMGIDIGSQSAKGVVISHEGVLASFSCPSGIDYRATAQRVKEALMHKIAGCQILKTLATGCGSDSAEFADAKAPDVQCSARGIFFADATVRTVVEIGAKTSRVMQLNSTGNVIHFSANNRCAAGGGVFLQVMAKVLRVNLEEIGRLSLKSRNPVRFSTGCAVFGETEAITRISEGYAKEDILAGAHMSIGEKIAGMILAIGLEEKCAVIGGGGLNKGLVKAIETQLGIEVTVPSLPDMICALGAAVMARQKADIAGAGS